MDLSNISNARDKMILIIFGVISLGCLVGIYMGVDSLKEPLVTIVGALAMGFKGNPSPPDQSTTTETTTSSTSPPGPPTSTVDPSPSTVADSLGGPLSNPRR